MAKTQQQMQEEMDELLRKVEEEIGVGKIAELDSYKALAAAIGEVQRRKEEHKAREEKASQMIDVDYVSSVMHVSKSTGYKIIRQLNEELSQKGYITVRGRVSRAYFERRTYHAGE